MKNNSITIIGFAGNEPETKSLSNGKQVTSFSLACKDYQSNSTEWFTVDAWNEAGDELSEFISKGSMVKVTGALKVNRFERKDSSGKDVRLAIVLDTFEVLPRQMTPAS